MVLGRRIIPPSPNPAVCFFNPPIFMSPIDWIVLTVTLSFIILYGIYKHRNDKTLDGYLLGNKTNPILYGGPTGILLTCL